MAGLSQGGDVGLSLANWMTQGDPGFDIWAMDVARFGDWATRAYTGSKVRENYRRRFSISFPNEYLPEGRPLVTTPIYPDQLEAGGVFGDSFGLELPLWFAPEAGTAEEITFGRSNAWPYVREEVSAVRNDVGLMESSGFAKFLVEGPRAREWLTHLVASRVPRSGRIALAPMCNASGNLAGDLTIACLPPSVGRPDGPAETITGGATANTDVGERFMIFGSGVAERYYERWFDAALAGWAPAVSFRTLGTELCGIALAGPKSRELLVELADADVSDDAMRFGSRAREFRPTYDPFEAGLGRFVRFARPAHPGDDFVGRAALIAKYGWQGPGPRAVSAFSEQMTLRTWTIDTAPGRAGFDVAGDEPIWCNGDPAGWVTSGGYAHYSDTSVALGYVPTALASHDVEFEVEIVGERRAARLLEDCLWDAAGTAMRS